MAFIEDYVLINNAAAQGDWSFSNWEPTDNTSASTAPNYIEGTACQFWPLSKGVTDGYAHLTTAQNEDVDGKLTVVWFSQMFADIVNIPITAMTFQLSGSATWPTGSPYARWNVLSQIDAPFNTPISGHIPMMVYPTNPDASAGTVTYTDVDHFGFVGTTGGVNDGKQGWFDMIFSISWVGLHSETHTDTFYDELYLEALDNNGGGIPGTTNRPLGVVGRAGDNFTFNVNIQMGDGTSDTANIVVDETGKSIFFSNVQPEQELGYVFVNPASTNELRFSLDSVVHSWTSQQSTHEIFTDASNADWFQLDGCSFTNGGQITLPADTVNRWVRTTKFDSCQAGTISDGEFTDNTVVNGEAFTVSGDADLSGTQFLTPVVAADASALVWNGNFDPNGNLDNMAFSKGTAAHHAIAFGIATPLTMTLTGIDFSGFNATNGQNDSTLHILRTSGTVTINLSGNTGDATVSYKSAGAIVVIQNTIIITFTGLVAGTEIRVKEHLTGTAADGIESTVGTTFAASLQGGTRYDWIAIREGYVVKSQIDVTYTVSQNVAVNLQLDPNFNNP